MAPSRHTTVLALTLLALVLTFHYVYRAPSPGLIAFISRVTGTSLGDLPNGGGGGAPSSSDSPADVAQETASPKPRHNFRSERYNAKLHMVNQLQLFIDYPIAYWLTVDVDIASWPWMSANLVSLVHPIFGFLSGYCIFKARHGKDSNNNKDSNNCNSAAMERAPLKSPHHPSLGAPSISPTHDGGGIGGANASHSDAAVTPHTRSRGLMGGNGSTSQNPIGTPGMAPASAEFDREMMQPAGSKDFGSPAIGGDGNNGAASSPVAVDMGDDDEGNAVRQAGGKDLFSSVDITLLRWASFFFWIRNFLDTLDGVIARVQRHRAGTVVTHTSMSGFNGHVLDMITDTAGVTFINVAIFVFLFSKNLALARLPSALLMRLGFRAHLHKSQVVSKAIAFVGLCMVGFLGLCWESTMLRYSNLFDVHANTNPAIFALDNDFQVRVTQFVWALTCGDMVLVYIIAAIWFNKLWECTQAMFFLGYAWMLLWSAYCSYVWHRVVLIDPEAARIVALSPELF